MKVGSGILAVSSADGRICLVWRSPLVNDGNRWGVIGGMLQDGMTVEQSAMKEVGEEVGYYGPITLTPALVNHRPGFRYHTFIGVVPEAFQYNPEPEYAWETSFLSWMPYESIVPLMAEFPHTFHQGLLKLFVEAKAQIEATVVRYV